MRRLWKTDFRGKNPVGLKISKSLTNGMVVRRKLDFNFEF